MSATLSMRQPRVGASEHYLELRSSKVIARNNNTVVYIISLSHVPSLAYSSYYNGHRDSFSMAISVLLIGVCIACPVVSDSFILCP